MTYPANKPEVFASNSDDPKPNHRLLFVAIIIISVPVVFLVFNHVKTHKNSLGINKTGARNSSSISSDTHKAKSGVSNVQSAKTTTQAKSTLTTSSKSSTSKTSSAKTASSTPGSSSNGGSSSSSGGSSGSSSGGSSGSSGSGSSPSPQTTWATCNTNANNHTLNSTFAPLSDSAAAALVTHKSEIRPYNAKSYTISGITYPAPTVYVPNSGEITSFRSAIDQYGQTPVQENPYNQYVDGIDGLNNPSTDDLIQWGAHKWGIPEDWLRAEYVQESQWSQYDQGDRFTETVGDYNLYPIQSQVTGSTTDIWESLGITQEKWRPADHPGGSGGVGTEPLRWKSIAFNIDYQLSSIRFEYDNPHGTRSSWGDVSYVPCQQWNSIGGWFEPYPWNNSGQQNYVSQIQTHLNNQDWTPPGFINETLTFPPAITFN